MPLISRADAARFAKITTTLTVDQAATLDDMVSAATPVIEAITGPVELSTRLFSCGPRAGPVVLPWVFVGVSSVTVDGVLVDSEQYDASRAQLGILDPAVGFNPWGAGTTVVVVAQVGSTQVPANVRQAALELVSYWWQSTQQNQRSAWQDGGPPMGFAVPQRVTELLAASPALPGFG